MRLFLIAQMRFWIEGTEVCPGVTARISAYFRRVASIYEGYVYYFRTYEKAVSGGGGMVNRLCMFAAAGGIIKLCAERRRIRETAESLRGESFIDRQRMRSCPRGMNLIRKTEIQN